VVLGVRRGTGTRGDTAGVGRGRDRGRARGRQGGAHVGGMRERDSGRVGARASRGGWVCRSAHRLVRPLGPGHGPIDPITLGDI
jgi:hypothetical protein